jgi:hypothetical protein
MIEAEPASGGLLQEEKLKDVVDSVKDLYPLYAQPRKQGASNDGVVFLEAASRRGIVKYFESDVYDDIEDLTVAFGKERQAFREMLPILDHVTMWRMDEASMGDLKDLLLIRIAKVKAEKKTKQQMNGTTYLTLPKTRVS